MSSGTLVSTTSTVDAVRALALDVGGTKLAACVVDRDGAMHGHTTVPTPGTVGTQACWDAVEIVLTAALDALAAERGVTDRRARDRVGGADRRCRRDGQPDQHPGLARLRDRRTCPLVAAPPGSRGTAGPPDRRRRRSSARRVGVRSGARCPQRDGHRRVDRDRRRADRRRSRAHRPHRLRRPHRPHRVRTGRPTVCMWQSRVRRGVRLRTIDGEARPGVGGGPCPSARPPTARP